MGKAAKYEAIENMNLVRVASSTAWYSCTAKGESIITSRRSLLLYPEVAHRLSRSLNAKETPHSCVLRMEQGTQRRCTACKKLVKIRG